jgi:hypothetical protein
MILFGEGFIREWCFIKHILDLFCLVIGMDINTEKSLILCNCLYLEVEVHIGWLFVLCMDSIDNGLKYLGYQLKPNDYRVVDWLWLVKKIKERINCCATSRLVLVKAVLKSILVY